MRYMLDTNICIYLIKRQPTEVVERFSQYDVGDIVISSITWAELWHGVAVSAERAQQNARALRALREDIPIMPFGESQAEAYGPLRATGSRSKAALDHLIAAHALSESCILVTNNERDFRQYAGLKIENWVRKI